MTSSSNDPLDDVVYETVLSKDEQRLANLTDSFERLLRQRILDTIGISNVSCQAGCGHLVIYLGRSYANALRVVGINLHKMMATYWPYPDGKVLDRDHILTKSLAEPDVLDWIVQHLAAQ